MGVGKCVSKENPKSDLDLDLGFVKRGNYQMKVLYFLNYHNIVLFCTFHRLMECLGKASQNIMQIDQPNSMMPCVV